MRMSHITKENESIKAHSHSHSQIIVHPRGRMGCHELTTTKDSLEIDSGNRHFKGEFVCEPWCHGLRAWIEESISKESSVSVPSF